MTDTLTETDVQDHFDQDGRVPGVYALELETPPDDDVAVIEQWFDGFEASPPGGLPKRFAECERLVYVGSHGKSVYARLCEHARGHKSSTIMELWPAVDIVAVWPEDSPKQEEYNRATELADEETVCWQDGNYL